MLAASRRVLLVHPGALGDLVQARAAFAMVRAAHPSATLALLTGETAATLAQSFELFDAVLQLDDRTAYHGNAVARARAFAAAVARARRFGPDHVGVFKAAFPYAALARGSGAPVRVGLTRGPGARLLTHAIPLLPGEHWEDRYAAVAVALGGSNARDAVAAGADWPERPLPPALGGALDAMRKRAAVLVTLAPGGARNVKGEMGQKRWASRNYAAFAVGFLAEFPNAAFVLLGSESDRADAAELRAAIPADRLLDLIGQTSLESARAVIARGDLFVGNDSSLLHIAATTRSAVVAVFGPTDPRAIAPRGPRVRSVWAPANGVPCHDEIAGTLGPCVGTCCIDRVQPEAVLGAARALVSAGTPAHRDQQSVHEGARTPASA